MVKIRVYVNSYESRVFEVLDKDEVIDILKNFDLYELEEVIKDALWQAWANDGLYYKGVDVYLDIRTGKLGVEFYAQGEHPHPYDDFYKVVLYTVYIPVDIPEEELVDYFEDRDIIDEAYEKGVSVERILAEKGLLEERVENVFDVWASEAALEIQKDKWRWKRIIEQIEEIYIREKKQRH